jgi:hypothetical protein
LAAAVNQQFQTGFSCPVRFRGELAGINVVRQQPGRAGIGNEEKAGAGYVAGRGDHLPEDGVGVAIIVNQPAGDAFPGEELLGLTDNLLKAARLLHKPLPVQFR